METCWQNTSNMLFKVYGGEDPWKINYNSAYLPIGKRSPFKSGNLKYKSESDL